MRALLRWLAYPLVTGGAVLFALHALARGWSAVEIGAVVVAATCVLVELLERVIPYSQAWARSRGDLGTDVWHFVLSNRFIDLGGFLAIVLLAPPGAALAARLGHATLWPTGWPLLAQAGLTLVLLELPSYWVHRLEHTRPLLWRLHGVHHSAERLYWWNFSRQHPLDNLLTAFTAVGLVALAGAPEPALAVATAFAVAHGFLQHSNVDLRTGPALDLVLATARVHRWHHSRVAEESMANYGGVLTVWDHVFRTRRFPADVAPPEDVGLYPGSPPLPQGFLGQMKAPFVGRLWRA